MVAKRHKITNVPLFKKLWDIIFFFWDNNFLSYFSKCPSKWLKKLLSRKKKIMSRSFLKVVGNEKQGGSGVWLLLEYGAGPWRSMSVYFFM